jgi:hypothetical protein
MTSMDACGEGYDPRDPYRDEKRRELVLLTGKFSHRLNREARTIELLGVALLLGDKASIRRAGESETTVLARWAYQLFQREDARLDVGSGCPHTRAWFAQALEEVRANQAALYAARQLRIPQPRVLAIN